MSMPFSMQSFANMQVSRQYQQPVSMDVAMLDAPLMPHVVATAAITGGFTNMEAEDVNMQDDTNMIARSRGTTMYLQYSRSLRSKTPFLSAGHDKSISRRISKSAVATGHTSSFVESTKPSRRRALKQPLKKLGAKTKVFMHSCSEKTTEAFGNLKLRFSSKLRLGSIKSEESLLQHIHQAAIETENGNVSTVRSKMASLEITGDWPSVSIRSPAYYAALGVASPPVFFAAHLQGRLSILTPPSTFALASTTTSPSPASSMSSPSTPHFDTISFSPTTSFSTNASSPQSATDPAPVPAIKDVLEALALLKGSLPGSPNAAASSSTSTSAKQVDAPPPAVNIFSVQVSTAHTADQSSVSASTNTATKSEDGAPEQTEAVTQPSLPNVVVPKGKADDPAEETAASPVHKYATLASRAPLPSRKTKTSRPYAIDVFVRNAPASIDSITLAMNATDLGPAAGDISISETVDDGDSASSSGTSNAVKAATASAMEGVAVLEQPADEADLPDFEEDAEEAEPTSALINSTSSDATTDTASSMEIIAGLEQLADEPDLSESEEDEDEEADPEALKLLHKDTTTPGDGSSTLNTDSSISANAALCITWSDASRRHYRASAMKIKNADVLKVLRGTTKIGKKCNTKHTSAVRSLFKVLDPIIAQTDIFSSADSPSSSAPTSPPSDASTTDLRRVELNTSISNAELDDAASPQLSGPVVIDGRVPACQKLSGLKRKQQNLAEDGYETDALEDVDEQRKKREIKPTRRSRFSDGLAAELREERRVQREQAQQIRNVMLELGFVADENEEQSSKRVRKG